MDPSTQPPRANPTPRESLGHSGRIPKGRERRRSDWDAATTQTFDVVIIGAGVNGASIFDRLRRQGYRVLLVDRGDFAGGTSQASGMLLWGGLLYLKSLDLRTVRQLCRARDRWIASKPEQAQLARFRYLPLREGGRSTWLVRSALELYWWLGGKGRARPRMEKHFATQPLLAPGRFRSSLTYEEACLPHSDARLVLDWILGGRSAGDGVALNHVEVHAGRWERGSAPWTLSLRDRDSGECGEARAQFLINAAGVWADDLAQQLELTPHYRHVMSKGVYLGLPRPPELDEFLAFEMGEAGDSQTFTPWGPIALWGPTETSIQSLQGGFEPNVEDVRFLLEQANRNLAYPTGPEDIVSLRTGVRPLAVERSFSKKVYPLDLSRRHVVDQHTQRNALTVFGGKLTSAPTLAQQVLRSLDGAFPPSGTPSSFRAQPTPTMQSAPTLPGGHAQQILTPFVDPAFARDQECCLGLADYLRRRTNWAQWIPRLGLGREDEHLLAIRRAAQHFGRTEAGVQEQVSDWQLKAGRMDALLRSI